MISTGRFEGEGKTNGAKAQDRPGDIQSRRRDARHTGATGHTGGTFTTYLGELKRRGLVVEQNGEIAATDEALEALGGKPPAPTSHDEAMVMWRRALKAGCYRMLEAVVQAREAGVGRGQLADEVGMTVSGGTFTTYLGILRRNGLVSGSGGLIAATDVLFPEGVVI